MFKILHHLRLLFFPSQPLIQSACVKTHARDNLNYLDSIRMTKHDIQSAFCEKIFLRSMGDIISAEFNKLTHSHHCRACGIV